MCHFSSRRDNHRWFTGREFSESHRLYCLVNNRTFYSSWSKLLQQEADKDEHRSTEMIWIFEGLKLAPRMLIKRLALFGCNFMVILSFSEPFCSFHGWQTWLWRKWHVPRNITRLRTQMRLMYHAWKHQSESFSKYLCTAYECTATPNSSGCLWSAHTHNDRTVSRRQLGVWAPQFCIHKTSSTTYACCLATHSRSQLISSAIKCGILWKNQAPVKRATMESRLFTFQRAQLHRVILWAKRSSSRWCSARLSQHFC